MWKLNVKVLDADDKLLKQHIHSLTKIIMVFSEERRLKYGLKRWTNNLSQSEWQPHVAGWRGWFTLIIHIFTHFKAAQAESFMRPFCALPLNKYVNYWAQQLPQNMPSSSQICAAFPGKEPRTPAEDSSQTHGYVCAALCRARRNRRLRASSEPERWVQSVVKPLLCCHEWLQTWTTMKGASYRWTTSGGAIPRLFFFVQRLRQ